MIRTPTTPKMLLKDFQWSMWNQREKIVSEGCILPVLASSKYHCLKAGLHVTSAFAISFDLCRAVLENTNVKCKHQHLLPQNPLLTFDANAKGDVTCKQGLKAHSH